MEEDYTFLPELAKAPRDCPPAVPCAGWAFAWRSVPWLISHGPAASEETVHVIVLLFPVAGGAAVVGIPGTMRKHNKQNVRLYRYTGGKECSSGQ